MMLFLMTQALEEGLAQMESWCIWGQGRSRIALLVLFVFVVGLVLVGDALSQEEDDGANPMIVWSYDKDWEIDEYHIIKISCMTDIPKDESKSIGFVPVNNNSYVVLQLSVNKDIFNFNGGDSKLDFKISPSIDESWNVTPTKKPDRGEGITIRCRYSDANSDFYSNKLSIAFRPRS